MPRPSRVPVEDAVAVIKLFINYFRTDTLPRWSDGVWQEMSDAFKRSGFDWSSQCVITNVTLNRRNILTLAREQMGITVKQTQDCNDKLFYNMEQSDDEEENDICDTSDDAKEQSRNFNVSIKSLVITEVDWKKIKPDYTDDKPKLQPREWTNIISSAMWHQYRMPCAFIFKRADVRKSPDMSYTISFFGRCKSKKCKNTIKGWAEKKVEEESGIVFAVETRDTREESHEDVKRPLNGKRRQEAYKDLKTEGCAKYRKCEARNLMFPGDVEPAILPSNDVLRQAKKEGIDKNLGIDKREGRDIVRAIEEMPLNPRYSKFVHEVSGFPFRVLYGSPAQFRIYNEYRRLNRSWFTVSLDATGSLVTRLARKNGTKSGHIFLYAIVINFSGTTASVYQMLSERHDSVTIMIWLLRWIQIGGVAPKEAVCDYSRALLMGISMAFNKQPIKSYISERFTAVLSSSCIPKPPPTFIRVDVAHFIHMVCRWKSLKDLRHRAIKDFYVRCVTLMVECQTLAQFERVFQLTSVVALQPYEDSSIYLEEIQTPKDARKMLETLISRGNITDASIDYDEEQKRNTPFRREFAEAEDDKDREPEIDDMSEKECSIEHWIDNSIEKSRKTLFVGKDINAFFLPDFMDRFSAVAKEFPLWSAVGMPPNTKRATSTYVEGFFKELKTSVLKHYTLPISIDKFIREQAQDIEGTNCIISGKLVQHNNKRLHEKNFEKYNNSDLFAVENWRGKGGEEAVRLNDFEKCESDCGAERDYENIQKDHSYCKVFNQKKLIETTSTPIETKQQKISKYFRAFPEIRQQNIVLTDLKKPPSKNVTLLPNGSISSTLFMDGCTYLVRNSCAFDSVIQILATAATDGVEYREFLLKSTNSTLKFVADFIEKGVSKSLLIERARILANFCKPQAQGVVNDQIMSYLIDAYNNVANTVVKTLNSDPSLRQIEECTICGKRERNCVTVAPNHSIITTKGFAALQEALELSTTLYNIQCLRDGCPGTYTRVCIPSEHIFIELDVRHSADLQKSLKCSLGDLPKKMHLGQRNQVASSAYRLAGVVERLPEHYIAHCLRTGGLWQKFNDMDNKPMTSNSKTSIEPHLAIYIRQNK